MTLLVCLDCAYADCCWENCLSYKDRAWCMALLKATASWMSELPPSLCWYYTPKPLIWEYICFLKESLLLSNLLRSNLNLVTWLASSWIILAKLSTGLEITSLLGGKVTFDGLWCVNILKMIFTMRGGSGYYRVCYDCWWPCGCW